MRTIKYLITVGCLALLAAPAAGQDGIGWLADWRSARDLAKSQNRPVLLHFWSTTCVPCKQLERNVFTRSDVARAISAGYIPVKVNVEQSPELAEFYQVESVPTDIIVDPNGRVLHSTTSPHDPNQYIAMLDSIKAHFYAGTDGSRVARSRGGPTAQPSGYPANNTQPAANAPRQPSPDPNGRSSTYAGRSQNYLVNRSQQPPNQSAVNPLHGANQPRQANIEPQYGNPYGGPGNPSQGNETRVQWNQHVNGNQTSPGNYGAAGGAGFGATPGAVQPSSGNPPWSRQTPQGTMASNGPRDTQPGFGGGGLAAGGQRAQPTPPGANRPQPSPSGPQLGLDGYCPVSLVEQSNWSNGDRRWGVVHRGRLYLFANQAHQQRFYSNPDGYTPVLSGYDPVRYGETGQLVDGRREHGLYFGNQYYLFADEASLERFRLNPQRYVAFAQQAMHQTSEQPQAR